MGSRKRQLRANRRSKFVLNKKRIEDCTEAEIQTVYEVAKCHAARRGRPHLSDEFASFLMEDLVKQGYMNYNLHWRWAQFLRETFGNLSNKTGRAQRIAETSPKQIEDAGKTFKTPVATVTLPDESSVINAAAAAQSKRLERAAFVLHTKWGFTLDEIADCFGCSKQWVRILLDRVYMSVPVRNTLRELR